MLEWAEDDDTVDSIRLKTAMHFSEGKNFAFHNFFATKNCISHPEMVLILDVLCVPSISGQNI